MFVKPSPILPRVDKSRSVVTFNFNFEMLEIAVGNYLIKLEKINP